MITMMNPDAGRQVPRYAHRGGNQLAHTPLICWVAWMLILGTSCQARNGKLLFQTGFEEGSVLTQSGQNADIFGRDLSVKPPNDWVTDLEGTARTGDFTFYYQGGTVADRYAAIVRDPTGMADNRVLRFWLKRGVVPRGSGGRKGRIQTELYRNADDFNEFYFTFAMYIDSSFEALRRVEEEIDYVTLQEFWNNPDWTDEPYAFRVRINLYKERGLDRPLYFQVLGQRKNPSAEEWESTNKTVPVETGTWADYLIYYKLGDRHNGRFYLQRSSPEDTPQVLCDVTNWTHHPQNPSPLGMRYFTPFKLYTHAEAIDAVHAHGGVMQLYFDDFKLYEGRPRSLSPAGHR